MAGALAFRGSSFVAMAGLAACLAGCAAVGPEFEAPAADSNEAWSEFAREEFAFEPLDAVEWWTIFEDPVLDRLIDLGRANNNNVRVAGLRVLEARAVLDITLGNRYPQTQVIAGDATRIQASESNANTAGAADLSYWQYNVGASASWELDFWGRFRRGIEAADASLLASIASYDDALVLLTAQVADVYANIRAIEEQLRIARQNVVLQERSYEIVEVQFRFGASSELDVQQAQTLLLSTQATIPGLEVQLRQAHNALAALLGLPPTDLSDLLDGEGNIPDVPEDIMVGVPADMLRQRPDVRRAEWLAMAQSAQVGVATADLYPSFSISGSLGLAASGDTNTTRTGDSGIGELFRADSLTYAIGPSFVWPFLNYDRIKSNVRIQDARLQQALVQYRETVIQAAREAENAMIAFVGLQRQDQILDDTVESAIRSSDLSLLRYQEGFADYQRVLDAQQALFRQQQRYATNKGAAVRSLIALYRALGGGWQSAAGRFVDDESRLQMEQRTDWDGLLEADRVTIRTSDQEPQ